MFGDRRWRRFLPRLLALLAVQFVALVLLGLALFGSTAEALAVAGALIIVVAAGTVLYTDTVWSDRPAGRRRWVIVGLWAAGVGLCAGLVLHRWLEPPWPVVVAAGLLGALVSGAVYARQSPRTVGAFQLGLTIVRVATPGEAQAVVTDSTRALDDPGLPPARRTVAELNRARARTLLALRRGQGHELQEALGVLRRTIQDRDTDPVLAVLAADDLVNAMSLAAEQTRDPRGYAEARKLLAYCLERAPDVDASARLYGHRAQFYLFFARDDITFYGRALAAQQEAVRRATRPSAADLAQLGLVLSLAITTGVDRSDEAIAFCRRAVTLDRGDETRLYLAMCLCYSTQAGGPLTTARRDEARALLGRLARRTGPTGLRANQLLVEFGLAS